MEKYFRIIEFLVQDRAMVSQISNEFTKLYSDPSYYIEHSNRMITKSHDYLWLGMIDLLIKHGFAFEMDWKDDYETAQEVLNRLFIKNNLNYELKLDLEQDTELDLFFALVNKELEKQGNYRIYSLDIDSDSYVSALGKPTLFLDIKNVLDQRITVY